jgi:probable F420-dependent oxidoreductase
VSVGISVYDMPAAEIVALGAAADELGYDALWLGEHVVLPVGYGSAHPTHDECGSQHHTGPIVSPDTELVDQFTVLGAVAASTTRLRVATGIHILPLRHPLLTARAGATLQDVSGGRFLLGLGAGWLREEFTALGVPFAERRERFSEGIQVLRAAWRGGPFEHHGTHFDIDSVQVTARPMDVPIVLGGNSERALQDAAVLADAWFSSGTPSYDDALRLRDRLSALATRAGREPPRCFVRIARPDAGLIARYHAENVHDLVIWADQVWPAGPAETKRSTLADAATHLGLA